jgi:type III secretion protein HrpB1
MDVLKGQSCPQSIVEAVVELVTTALDPAGATAQVECDDVESVIDALHAMRPGCAEFSFFDGWLHVRRQEWSEAECRFLDLVERSICLPQSKAMLLQCLMAQQKFGWREETKKIAEMGGDDPAVALARALIATDDMVEAMETASRTGEFVVPDSMPALQEGVPAVKDGTVEPMPHAAAGVPLSVQYMRI